MRESSHPDPVPSPGPLRRWWRTASPLTRVATLLAVFLGLAVMAAAAEEEPGPVSPTAAAAGKVRNARTVPPPVQLDSTTIYNSVATAFIKRFNTVMNDDTRVSSDRSLYCPDGDTSGVSVCAMQADVLGPDPVWVYLVEADPKAGPTCWKARTQRPFGDNQDAIDDYRMERTFAPTKRETASLVREGRRMRKLRGCASPLPVTAGRNTDANFIARYAAQNVKREFGGKQMGTRCFTTGRDERTLAPDVNVFKCTTTLRSGRRYVDSIECSNEPPYRDFSSCTSVDDYPRTPPRSLPG